MHGHKQGPVHNMETDIDINITRMPAEGGRPWYGFTFTVEETGNRYEADMLAFDEPSIYGIDNGRISKLFVRDANGKAVIAYDRDWEIEPATAEAKSLLALIVGGYN